MNLDLSSLAPAKKLRPITMEFGDESFDFSPMLSTLTVPRDDERSLAAYLDWLSAHVMSGNADRLAIAVRTVQLSNGIPEDVILGKIVASYIAAVQAQVEDAAERPTPPPSGASRSSKSAKARSVGGSSRARAGA